MCSAMAELYLRPRRSRYGRAAELAAEAGDEPEEKGESGAEQERSDDGEVDRDAFAAVDDVAGEAAEAEGELAVKIEQDAEEDEQAAKEEQDTAELAEWIHGTIIEDEN